jgi:hypothetical protein
MTEYIDDCCLCDCYVVHEMDWPFCPACVARPLAERNALFRAWTTDLRMADRPTAENAFDVLIDGRIYPLHRSGAYIHPPAVHAALDTASETDLQFFLDTLVVADFYTAAGTYRGRDASGIGIADQHGATATVDDDVRRLVAAMYAILETWPSGHAIAWEWDASTEPADTRIHAETICGDGLGYHEAFSRGLSADFLAAHLIGRSRVFGTTLEVFCRGCGDVTLPLPLPIEADEQPLCDLCRQRGETTRGDMRGGDAPCHPS